MTTNRSALLLAPLAGIAAGVVTAVLMTPNPVAADQLPGTGADAALIQRLDGLAGRLDRIEASGQERSAPGVTRTEVGVDREAIAAVVREILADSEMAGSAPAGRAGADEDPTALDLSDTEAVLAQLREFGVASNEARAIWERAKREGRLQELLDAFQTWADANPGDPDVQCDLARAYNAAGMQDPNHPDGKWWQSADEAYGAALELNPQHWDARFEKAVTLTFWPAVMGRQPEAIQHFETLIEQSRGEAPRDEHAEAYVYLGNLHMQNGNMEKARQLWSEGLGRFPNSESLRGKVTGGGR